MRHLLPFLAVLCLAFAPAPLPKHARRPADTLLGEWVLVSETIGGEEQALRDFTVTFYGDHLVLRMGQSAGTRWEYRVVLAGRTKAFDMWIECEEGPDLTKFVYAFVGRRLVACYFHDDGRERPAGLSMPGERYLCVQVFERR
jgi:uncharacterized protein (TIGR03067 family)